MRIRAGRAGRAYRRSSLLKYTNRGKNAGAITSALLKTRQSKTAQTSALTKITQANTRAKYERQGKAADELSRQIAELTKSGEKGLYEKSKETGDTAELGKQAQNLVKKCNDFVDLLETKTDSLELFYGQALKEVFADHKDALAKVGVTAAKDGRLQVDQTKMKQASPQEMEEVFGEKSDFMKKLRFVADKVSDHAQANVKSVSGNYSQNGNMNYYYNSRYDFWG